VKGLIETKRLPSVPNHKLSKNVYLENIRSVFLQVVMSQTDLAMSVCVMVVVMMMICWHV
jgi:hypothetical protein